MSDNITNLNSNNPLISNLTRFYGFYDNQYKDPFIGGNAFIFITKPLLFIDDTKPTKIDNKANMAYLNMTRDPFFNQYLVNEVMNTMDRKILESLSYNTDYSKSSFLPIFTNECKNFDSNDSSLETIDSFETKQGYKQVLPSHKTISEAANTISISVTEDSNLDFTKMISLWVNYISNISDGTFDANPDMVASGSLDYMSSIYYFVLEPDGRTLKYWCKYTGCWPTTIPYSNMKYSKGQQDIIDLDIPFSYTIKEDMNPKILEEFNIVSLKSNFSGSIPTTEINNMYSSVIKSPLLNREEMIQQISNASEFLTASERDPIVLYIPENSKGLNPDNAQAHFELLFDDYGYTPNFLNDTIGSGNYIINDSGTNDYAKTGEQKAYNLTSFWDEED